MSGSESSSSFTAVSKQLYGSDDENLNSSGVQKESDGYERHGDCSDSEENIETDYTMDDSDEGSSDDAY